MAKWLLLGILTVAFILRIVAIDRYPVGLNPDEASLGFDAYSLLKTGKDQWGHAWPLSFQSFGDYKLPLYSYLAIPGVALFGLNEFSTRLPNAIFGILAVLATYLMVNEIFRNKKFALFSALLLAISPWHISLSRGAFEANLTTFLLPFGVWTFYKGLKNPKWLIASAFVLGINLFSYHSARLVTPLIAFSLWFVNRKQLPLAKNMIPFAIFIVFALVAGWTLLGGGASRGQDVAIFNPTDRGESIFQRRNEAGILGMPDQISRMFSNKVSFTVDEFIKNYTTYFSLQFLFTEGPKERTYGMIPGFGVLYLIELLFIITAFYALYKTQDKKPFLLLLVWILLAPIPAALAKGGGFAANRSAIMMPVVQIISAYGLLYLWEHFKKARLLFLLTLLISLTLFLENYLFHAPINSASSMHYGKKEMVNFVSDIERNYDEIIVSRGLSEPHIFFGFYKAWDPIDYQKNTVDWARYKLENRSFIDQLGEYKLGKYTFTDIKFDERSGMQNILLVGKPEEFPKNIKPLETIFYPGGKPAILIVDPAKVSYVSN